MLIATYCWPSRVFWYLDRITSKRKLQRIARSGERSKNTGSSSEPTMRKAAVVAMLLALMVVTSGSATRAAARALPGEQPPASAGGSTNNALPPPRSSSEHGRGLHRLLLPVEEEKSQAGHSCGTYDKNSPPCP
ncbi:hypothetical protein GQ55_1G378700 [Panicum hallii var. hallii]|uniref:Uncharacterized protein n=1 Tax=Panicum hallii var. hallii TaxID=1504633 RepID=A0A2T7FBR7_9POAL|nr:hypothetical protein GQ55_1G378700 [Panicum hallii var. hallii]